MQTAVAIQATPLSEIELGSYLYAAYRQVFGAEPGVDELAGAWAQAAIETAHGAKMRNFNFGNVTTTGTGPDYFVVECRERVHRDPDEWKMIKLKFVSFASALDGARGHWAILRGRFAPALELFRAGEFSKAAEKLSSLGYFTAPIENSGYRYMADLAADFKTRILPQVNLEGLRATLGVSANRPQPVSLWPVGLAVAAFAGLIGWQLYDKNRESAEREEARAEADRELSEELRQVME